MRRRYATGKQFVGFDPSVGFYPRLQWNVAVRPPTHFILCLIASNALLIEFLCFHVFKILLLLVLTVNNCSSLLLGSGIARSFCARSPNTFTIRIPQNLTISLLFLALDSFYGFSEWIYLNWLLRNLIILSLALELLLKSCGLRWMKDFVRPVERPHHQGSQRSLPSLKISQFVISEVTLKIRSFQGNAKGFTNRKFW